MGTPVIIDAVRTPLGKRRGWLAGVHPANLLGHALTQLLERSGLDPAEVDQVIGGCVTQAGEQSNDMVRRSWLNAGLPQRTGATTIDAQCGSGQQSAHLVNDLIAAGSIDVGIACGIESMSRIPLGGNVPPGLGSPRPDGWTIDMPDQFGGADRIARNRGLTREDLDAFGLASQQKARVAVDEGRFTREIAPLKAPVLGEDGPTGETQVVDSDQGLRDTTLEGLAGLKPVLDDGLHTAGTSSQISDGASAVLIMDADKANSLGLTGRAPGSPRTAWSAPTRTTTWTARSTRRTACSTAPAGRSRTSTCSRSTRRSRPSCCRGRRCTRSTWTGSTSTAARSRSAIPVGSTGTRLITTALHELERRDAASALISMCAGGAMATGTILERM